MISDRPLKGKKGSHGGLEETAMKPFVGPTVISMLFCMTIAFVAANYVDRDWSHQSFGKDVDWRMLQAGAHTQLQVRG